MGIEVKSVADEISEHMGEKHIYFFRYTAGGSGITRGTDDSSREQKSHQIEDETKPNKS